MLSRAWKAWAPAFYVVFNTSTSHFLLLTGNAILCWDQIGKKFEGELIDMHPEAKEGVAVATVDLDEMNFTRARRVSCPP